MLIENNASKRFDKNRAISFAVMAAVFSFAISTSAAHLDPVQQKLNARRQQWQLLNVDEYDYHFQRICFCSIDFTSPGLVRVSGGEIAFVRNPQTMDPLDPSFFLTVDGLFDEVQRAIDSHAAEIVADYDGTFGYPTSLDIDFLSSVIDEEVSFRASELRVVPEPNGVVLLILGLVSVVFLTSKSRNRRAS